METFGFFSTYSLPILLPFFPGCAPTWAIKSFFYLRRALTSKSKHIYSPFPRLCSSLSQSGCVCCIDVHLNSYANEMMTSASGFSATLRAANGFFSPSGAAEEAQFYRHKLKSVSELPSSREVKSHGASLLKISFSSPSSATAAAISCLCLSPSSRRIALNCVLVYNNFPRLETCCRLKTT